MSLKRYALFAGADYYPSGGWKDHRGYFDSIEAALIVATAPDGSYTEIVWDSLEHDWWQVVDLTTGQIVYEGDRRDTEDKDV